MNHIRTAIVYATKNKSEIGLEDMERAVKNMLVMGGTTTIIAQILDGLGWVRDGWLGSGDARQSRYVRRHQP